MSQTPGPAGGLPVTRWSLVERAGSGESTVRRGSLGELVALYRPALKAHLVQTRRIDPQRADDLVQEFLAAKFLKQNILGQADRGRGRFRSFVLASLDNFLIDKGRRSSAKKRIMERCRTIDPDVLAAQPAEGTSPTEAFDVAWAREVLDRVLSMLRAECEAEGRRNLWDLFEQRVVIPTFNGTPAPEYHGLLQPLHFQSRKQAMNALTTAKRKFQGLLRQVISEYVESEAEIDEEIGQLHTILARCRPT